MKLTLPSLEIIESQILTIRGQRVMLDSRLAELYGVTTKALNQAVSRNKDRFPADFMFQLSATELENWRSQFVISNPSAKMGLRRPPYVFTQDGVAMLSSVLRSPRAIHTNIAIMRTFTKMREAMSAHKDLSRRLNDMERKYDKQFKSVFDAIRDLMEPPSPPKKPIGYIRDKG